VRRFGLTISPLSHAIGGGKSGNNSALFKGLADLIAEAGIPFRPRG
jgi:hypothetical protein